MFRHLTPILALTAALAGQETTMPSGVFIALPEAPSRKTAELRTHAARTQAGLRVWLTREKVDHRSFSISNQVYIPKPTPALVETLRGAGYTIEAEKVYHIPPPIKPTAAPQAQGVEWGVRMLKAPELWEKGERGEGAVVVVIDTGFDPEHPAIRGRWAGLWADPAKVCPGAKPCDNAGHGSHVTGTILGADGANQIGVAPEAKFASCKGCESSACSQSSLLACAEWALDPAGDGTVKPVAVSNSWGGGGGDTWFQDVVRAWRANGILPVFAAGNAGPSCTTANSPGDYPESLAVAAVDVTESIASFSSRGPGRMASGLQKPDLAAPGVSVRSSVPGGNYAAWSGTSMATPHVAGAAALLNRRAKGDIAKIQAALSGTAVPRPAQGCGEEYPTPNYSYGHGIVDVAAAWASLPEVPGPPDPPPPPPPPTPPPPPPPPNQPPRVEIVAPANLSSVPCGQPIRLSGNATDPEDGDLTPQIVWSHLYYGWRGGQGELLGPTGAGCELGWHWISAQVSDSAGATTQSTVMVEVVPGLGQARAARTPVSGWWGDCKLDLTAIGQRLSRGLTKWSRPPEESK